MKTPPIDLMKARVFRRPWATIRRWRTRDGLHAIECSRIEYGRDTDEPYADVFRVLACDRYGWRIVSRHRRRAAAVRALGKLLRRPKPRPK